MVLFIVVAIAQSATIGLPAENQKLNSGKEVIVQVQRPVSSEPGMHSSSNLAIAILYTNLSFRTL